MESINSLNKNQQKDKLRHPKDKEVSCDFHHKEAITMQYDTGSD